ncbi:VWA domain containing CoxE-like protein [compost metagenome]
MDNSENIRRWRMMLGSGPADGTGFALSDDDNGKDAALGALYEYNGQGSFYGNSDEKGKGGKQASAPNVARWLGDIRKFFPNSTVQLLQRDAMKNESLRDKMLLEPEILEQTTPDIHTVATLLNLGKLIPEKTKSTARMVVQKVVDELMEKLRQNTISSIQGALNKAAKKKNPKYQEIDWHTTIRRNLKNYLPEYKTIIPEVRIGFGRKMQNNLKDVVLCLDQSGSMGTSVVYSGIFGSVMASIPAVRTKMLVFDTQVTDLTEELNDPVDLLFGVQLGGGTDINLALSKCQEVIEKPDDTILVLITDLYEGGNEKEMLSRVDQIVESGVAIICLLALNDDGTPSYDHQMAKEFNKRNIPVFACTPDLFPDMMSRAIIKEDLESWAATQGIVMKKG